MNLTRALNGDLQIARKTLAFDGTANLGEFANPNVPVFTITGMVEALLIFGRTTESFASAGGGTLSLGVTGGLTLFIGNTTATALTTTAAIWASTTPNAFGIAAPAALKDIIIMANVIMTVGTADVTDGTLEIHCYYMPLSAGSGLA